MNRLLLATGYSILQTVLYGLVLWLAYHYWSAPNAGLIIGTAFIIWLSVFWVVVFLQNLFFLRSRWYRWSALPIGFCAMAPFALYWDWLTPLLLALIVLAVLLPFLIRWRGVSVN